LLTLPAIAVLGGGNAAAQLRHGVSLLFGMIGLVSAGLWLVTWRNCQVRRALPREAPNLRALLTSLATNRRWYLANSLTFLNFMVFCSQIGMAIYYTRLVLGHPAHDASLLLGCSTVGALIGSVSVPLLTARLGLRRTYLALLVWQALCLLAILAAGGHFAAVLGATVLEFLAIGPISPLCLAMLSAAVDEGRERTGISTAGLAFSSNTLVSKVASGFAGFLLATFLALGKYDPAAMVTPVSLLHWLKLGFVGLPLTAMALQFALVLFSRRE
jgi:GPH family glycoside/pentoside/hexuronide:cation symporter